jgi:hypothetical protein
MKPEQDVQVIAQAILRRITLEYADLLSSSPFSIQQLLTPDHFRLDEFCKEFYPHPQSDELKRIAEIFGQDYGIWLANAKHHITCALFLYPTAHSERMFTMMKNLIIGFYLNDTMGRDAFKFLSHEEQQKSRRMIRNMADLNEDLHIPSDAHPIEVANAEALMEFRDGSPRVWFRKFLRLYCHHLDITHTDGNVSAQGRIPDIYEYMERRLHLGGVHHILHWIEYSNGQFLEWDLFGATRLSRDLKRLHWVTAAFAGLSNDLFSFEKEVIDCGADSNLVMIIALNRPELSLKEAILRASDIVRNLLTELIALIGSVKQEMETIAGRYPALGAKLNMHLEGIMRCVQAIWTWHCYSKRYKRAVSIWKETTLVAEPPASGVVA